MIIDGLGFIGAALATIGIGLVIFGVGVGDFVAGTGFLLFAVSGVCLWLKEARR